MSNRRLTSTTLSPSDIPPLSTQVGRMLKVFGTARSRRGLTADEVLIFLAAGQLSFFETSGVLTARPITCVDISGLLNIPKETVRRKAARLISIGMMESTPQGLIVADINNWRLLANSALGR